MVVLFNDEPTIIPERRLHRLSHDDEDTISVTSVNSQRIFEGFLCEIMPPGLEEDDRLEKNGCAGVSRPSPHPRLCASWNSRNDFMHVTATPKPFRIFFDDIIATKKVIKDRFQLTAYILNNSEQQSSRIVSSKLSQNNGLCQFRRRRIYEIGFRDFVNFERTFLIALAPKIPPNLPKFCIDRSAVDNSIQRNGQQPLVSVSSKGNTMEFSSAPHQKPKALVLVNPFSGQKRAMELWTEHARPIFEEAGIPYQMLTTTKTGDATRIAHDLCLDEFGAVVVVSGDGLVAEVIRGLLTRRRDQRRALRLPILHIPGGTGNGLAASVAYQANEPFPARGVFCAEMALMLASARPRYHPLRLYHVETARDGHLPMFMSITWGLVADIDLGSERFRWAGMIRYHIEAFIRISRLPSVAKYRGRISYVPVTNKRLLRQTRLTTAAEHRRQLGDAHFKCDDVTADFVESGDHTETTDYSSSPPMTVEEAFDGTHVMKVPPLSEPVPSNWHTIDGEFVYVCLSSLSHLGSDLPYMPCARLEEEIFYLTFVDWRTLKSRFHMAQLLITIDRCEHLGHECFQTIPVRACRVEPAFDAGGYVALDGEACTSGQAFQVVGSALQATVVSRQNQSAGQP